MNVTVLSKTLRTTMAATILLALPAHAEKFVLGTIQSPTAPITLAAEIFADELKRLTEGRHTVNVVDSAQLGPALEQYQNVQSGAQDLFLDDIGWNGQFVKDYGVLAVPFAISGPEGFRAVMDSGLADGWRQIMRDEHGVATLSDTFIRSPRVVFTTRDVRSPNDMDGMKFRVPEIDVYFNSWESIGVNPTPVPWGELYLALRQGVVDGGEGPFTTILPTKFPEVAKFVLETNHLYSANTLIMNGDKFDGLSDEDRAHFAAATAVAEAFFLEQISELEGKDRIMMESEYGVTFVSPTPEQRAAFALKVSEAVPGFEASGLFGVGVYDKVLAAQ